MTDVEISTNEDTCLTYRGYIKFLKTVLKNIYPVDPKLLKSKYKQWGDVSSDPNSEIPNHLRLSIHPATGKTKLRQKTPWHCSMALKLDGSVLTGPRESFDDATLELVLDQQGRPSYYREKLDLFSWKLIAKVRCEPLYPCGWIIRPTGKRGIGFSRTDKKELFLKKAEEMGILTPWRFGLVFVVNDIGDGSRGSGNSLSAEGMPFHYGSLFKTTKKVNDGGTTEVIPMPPKLQFFTATLFASSNLLFEHLPAHTFETLKQTTWSASTTSFGSVTLCGMPLVVEYPVTKNPCPRYHELWPQIKTYLEPTEVIIEGCEQSDASELCAVLESLLCDSNLLVNDNISRMHT
ncbi:hypothetical protein BJ165DRAFT_1602311 [Panaeolus papilionaceus]|nr:hypothetical protein BJ165DRAFT_1602311 [Panaeolus papilionaceus]